MVAGHNNIENAVKDLKILWLEDIIKLELSKFGYRLSNNLLSGPIYQLMNSKGGLKQHRYLMQNKATPNLQRHESMLFNKSFMCKSIMIFNTLSTETKWHKQSNHLLQK